MPHLHPPASRTSHEESLAPSTTSFTVTRGWISRSILAETGEETAVLRSVWARPQPLTLSAGRPGSRGPRLGSTQLYWASSPSGPLSDLPAGSAQGASPPAPPGTWEASPVLPAAGLGSRGCLGPRCPVSDPTPSPPLPASLPFLPGEGMAGQPPPQRSCFRDAQGAALKYPLVPNLDIRAQWQRRCPPPARTGGLRKPPDPSGDALQPQTPVSLRVSSLWLWEPRTGYQHVAFQVGKLRRGCGLLTLQTNSTSPQEGGAFAGSPGLPDKPRT